MKFTCCLAISSYVILLMCAIKDWIFSNAGLVGLQAAVMDPAICKGIILLNISLRMLHIKKQPWYGRPLIKSFQSLLRWIKFDMFFGSRCVYGFSNMIVRWFSLFVPFVFRNTDLGKFFFKAVATPESVRNILCQVSNLIWSSPTTLSVRKNRLVFQKIKLEKK